MLALIESTYSAFNSDLTDSSLEQTSFNFANSMLYNDEHNTLFSRDKNMLWNFYWIIPAFHRISTFWQLDWKSAGDANDCQISNDRFAHNEMEFNVLVHKTKEKMADKIVHAQIDVAFRLWSLDFSCLCLPCTSSASVCHKYTDWELCWDKLFFFLHQKHKLW